MIYRQLGQSGLSIGALSFGSWITFKNQLDVTKAKSMIKYAFDQGINFFDNAEVYGQGTSEIIMGKVFKQLKLPRDEFCVSSKVFWGGQKPTQNGLNKKHVFDACQAALKRLQVQYLDLYFCHRPDPKTPIEETVWIMNDLIASGLVLYWGTSQWPKEKLIEAYGICEKRNLRAPTMEQPEYNMFQRSKVEVEFLTLYQKYGLGLTTWSPLASGLLSGKYNNGIPKGSRATFQNLAWLKEHIYSKEGKQKIDRIKKLNNIANDLGMKMSQLAIAWCLKNSNVSSIILGASKLDQLKENLKSITFLDQLTPDILNQIETILS